MTECPFSHTNDTPSIYKNIDSMDSFLLFIEDNWVSIAGAIIGLIYLFLEYKANVWMWAASIAMALFYVAIFYKTELYASMSIYIYFFGASIYGWIKWITSNRNTDTGDEIISNTPQRYVPYILTAVVAISLLIYVLLITLQPTDNPIYISIGDSLTTSLNIVALWMISRKWAQQWLLLIPANAISSILLFFQGDPLSGILFAIFFVVSILGYRKWRKLTKIN